jgi:carboxypeptidase Q
MREAGMAVAMLQQDGTRYFDVQHTENDTLAKVDAEALRRNVAAYATFAYLAAQAEGDFGSASVLATPEAPKVSRIETGARHP